MYILIGGYPHKNHQKKNNALGNNFKMGCMFLRPTPIEKTTSKIKKNRIQIVPKKVCEKRYSKNEWPKQCW